MGLRPESARERVRVHACACAHARAHACESCMARSAAYVILVDVLSSLTYKRRHTRRYRKQYTRRYTRKKKGALH
eukprot:363747-Chlamydomonas_euryale.AAC.3